jgi:hypothetical protein
MEGAEPTPQAAVEARTLELAKGLGLDTGRLKVLHVPEEAVAEPARYSVDPASHALVKHPLRANLGAKP